MELICKNCKFKKDIGNTTETGAAICTNTTAYFPINITDKCHLIPEKKELKCSDCKCLTEDFGCAGCSPEDSAYTNGSLCKGYTDNNLDQFEEIIKFWMVQGLYNREKINDMLDTLENLYLDLINQDGH